MKVNFCILVLSLAVALTAVPVFAADSFPDAVKISLKDYENCKLYSAPDLEGKVLEFSIDDASEFFADSKPVVDKNNENAKWYKVVYVWIYGDSLLRQVNKLPGFNNNFFYVRAEDITTSPADEYIATGINWLREGRPPLNKVGDVLELDEWGSVDKRVTIVLSAAATLFAEPKKGAQKIEVSKGQRLLGPIYATEDSFPSIYANMEEENWSLIVDVKTLKVLGWIKSEQLMEISEWIEPDIL